MIQGVNLVTYFSPVVTTALIYQLLKNDDKRSGMAKAGNEMIVRDYSKAHQWECFVSLL